MKKLIAITALLSAALNLIAQPLDDIAFRTVVAEKPVLSYEIPNERDILWQKRIWRILDVREKMNLPFTYPEAPFFNLLVKAAQEGDLTLYAGEKDDFSMPLSLADLDGILYRTDTVEVWGGEYESSLQIVRTEVNYEDVKRFRIREMWYFDSKNSEMKVRILGIAPVKELYSDNGDYIGEQAMFWVHFPGAREVLARETVFNTGNEAARMTWEDLFEMRLFSSYIYKEGNVRNNRLQDLYSGVELLQEAEKIKQEIFNYEQDMWSR